MGITETPKTAAGTTTTVTVGASGTEKVLTLDTFQELYKHVDPDVQIEAFKVGYWEKELA